MRRLRAHTSTLQGVIKADADAPADSQDKDAPAVESKYVDSQDPHDPQDTDGQGMVARRRRTIMVDAQLSIMVEDDSPSQGDPMQAETATEIEAAEVHTHPGEEECTRGGREGGEQQWTEGRSTGKGRGDEE